MANSILAQLAVEITARAPQFGAALSSAQKSLDGFAKRAESLSKSVNNALSFTGLAVGATALTSVITSAVASIKDFEYQMATVRAITGATEDEFNALRDSAIDLAAATKFTAKEVAELQTEYGRLGFSTSEILNATKATLALSTATGEDLAKSADVLGSTLRSFGIDARETGRVADVMAGAFNRSALGLENFSEAIKYVAPVAAAAGISLEETTAMLGVLADNGIRGSMAGTSLRKIISDVGGETGTLAERLQKLADKGLTGADAMSEVGRTAYASLLILAKNTDKTTKLGEALLHTSGEAQKAADIMGDTLAGDLDKLSSAYDSLIQGQGGFTTQLREVIQGITNLINIIREGSVVTDFLQKLISYTPNIYTLAKGFNYLTESAEDSEKNIRAIRDNLVRLRDAANARGEKGFAAEYQSQIDQLQLKFDYLRETILEIPKPPPPIAAKETEEAIVTLDSLRAKLKELNDIYATTDERQTGLMDNLRSEILLTEEHIAKLEAFRKKQKEVNDERAKFSFDPPVGLLQVAETFNKVQQEAEKASEEMRKFLDAVNPLAQSLSGVEFVETPDHLRKFIDQLKADGEELAKVTVDISGQVANGIAGIGEAIGSAIGSGEFANFGKGVLEAVAGFAAQLGQLMIALGIGEIAFKTAPGPAKIAAGVALVAAAAAVKAHLSKQKSLNVSANTGGGRGTGATAASGYGSQYSGNENNKIDLSIKWTSIDGRTLQPVLDYYTGQVKPRMG